MSRRNLRIRFLNMKSNWRRPLSESTRLESWKSLCPISIVTHPIHRSWLSRYETESGEIVIAFVFFWIHDVFWAFARSARKRRSLGKQEEPLRRRLPFPFDFWTWMIMPHGFHRLNPSSYRRAIRKKSCFRSVQFLSWLIDGVGAIYPRVHVFQIWNWKQVQAEDKDWADNGRIEYAVVDITNNGRNKFVINPQTGIIDSVGALKPGEKYTLTRRVCVLLFINCPYVGRFHFFFTFTQATDGGGKSSLGLLEVIIIPGPNVQAPVFTKDSYEISVDEGSPVNSLVYTFQVTHNFHLSKTTH